MGERVSALTRAATWRSTMRSEGGVTSRTRIATEQPVADVEIAASARLFGRLRLGHGAYLSQGLVIRSHEEAVSIGAGSAVLENCTVIGRPGMGVAIGRRTVFGHRRPLRDRQRLDDAARLRAR
jgi:serine acetyltransferase